MYTIVYAGNGFGFKNSPTMSGMKWFHWFGGWFDEAEISYFNAAKMRQDFVIGMEYEWTHWITTSECRGFGP